jgi:hypothetical protein
MINRGENVIDFHFSMVQNREIKFLPAELPPLQSSTKGKLIREKQLGFQSIREELGG